MEVAPPAGEALEKAIADLETYLQRIEKGLKNFKARTRFVECFTPLASLADNAENIRPHEYEEFHKQYYAAERRIKTFLMAEGTKEDMAREHAETLGNMLARVAGFSIAAKRPVA